MNIPTEVLRSFVAIADTGSFTQAATQVLRTQSAVSQQIQKLEDLIGRAVFTRDGRTISLTGEGEALLAYARRILKLHDEAVAAIVEPDIEGSVRFGIPDDYVSRFMPPILAGFARSHPRVQIEITCAPSVRLAPMIAASEIDIALITATPGAPKMETVRREPVSWAVSPHHLIHEEDPLPVAVFQPGCCVRQSVLEALDGMARPYRLAYASESHEGLVAAVRAGLAVTALVRSSIPQDFRLLGPKDGFPELPPAAFGVLRRPNGTTRAADSFADHLLAYFEAGAPQS